MRDIRVTYNIGQYTLDTHGMKKIITDLALRAATKVETHPDSYRFETLIIPHNVLLMYCEDMKIDFVTLTLQVAQLCESSKEYEIATYGQQISKIENVHYRIEADESIKFMTVPDAFGVYTQEVDGEVIEVRKTFDEMFTIEDLPEGRVRMSIVVNNNYPSQDHMVALQQFSESNRTLNIKYI